ncbi:uncharacterized protein LOC143371330 [Andrena cerasifolii]|uniref:uncharacterized protein LOC143371330 n=1 Tax=Andrena cerasifolii TaxID=2819439 RepID=UPI0040383EB1
MARSIAVVLFTALALLQAASAVDVSKQKNVRLEFTDKDGVSKTRLQGAFPEERGPGFIGDLTIGQRYADETVFRRVVEFNNPTNAVQTTTLALSVSNGVIHQISAKNVQGSYAVVCEDSNSLGTSRSTLNLRVSPNSTSSLILTIASH